MIYDLRFTIGAPLAEESHQRQIVDHKFCQHREESFVKKDAARSPGERRSGRERDRTLLLFLLELGRGGLSGLGLGQPLLELVHSTGSIDELLLARVKRVADVANADQN